MNSISLFLRNIKTWWIVVVVVLCICIGATAYTLGSLLAYKKNIEKFVAKQQTYNATVSRVIEKLTAAVTHNYEFNVTNKELLKRIAELEVPDEIALMHKIPARQ